MIALAYKSTSNFKVTSEYGARGSGFHYGIDLAPIKAGHSGDPIYAAQSGTVKIAQFNSSYGNYIVIDHGSMNFTTLYAHLKGFNTSVGQMVSGGQQIATMGNSGHVIGSIPPDRGTHLHFEVRNVPYSRWSGSYNQKNCLNPRAFLENLNSAAAGQIQSQQPESTTYERVILDQNSVESKYKLFGRKYRIMVFNENGEGVDISDLHCIFNLTKSITLDNSVSTVSVYNLNAKTEGEFIQKANRITVEAGYEGLFGLIFDGDVVQAIRSKEGGTDYKLTFISMDGDRFLNFGFSAMTVARGQTKRDIANSIVNNSSILSKTAPKTEIGSISESYSGSKYIRGKVVFGMAKDYLQQIASSENGSFYMNDGKVNLTRVADLPNGEIIKLDSESGLIDAPQQTDMGITFKCLINPRIKNNTLVNIDNSTIIERQYQDGSYMSRILDLDGVYRVVKMNYSGDTRGNDWYIECEAVGQAGANIPPMLAF